FQAEDGIRDGHVTGVQTCALPISASPNGEEEKSPAPPAKPAELPQPADLKLQGESATAGNPISGQAEAEIERIRRALEEEVTLRSEERRVGKECRCRRWRDHDKKK